MEFGACRQGSESQDSDEPVPPGKSPDYFKDSSSTPTASPGLATSSKGVENAKKRLRAFSIQKKAAVAPVPVVKPVSTGNTTVLIGKLSSVKVTPKPEKPTLEDDQKKPPKPPKPGASKNVNDSYLEIQKQTISKIEEMKRKMELVELGIPLGLVCPSTNALPVKAMPTKAMPPIKTFLAAGFRVIAAMPERKSPRNNIVKKEISKARQKAKRVKKVEKNNAKIDEIIQEARKAKAEGKEFKFDYRKFVPDYDNPFQRKKEQDLEESDIKEMFEKKEEEHRARTVKEIIRKDKDRRKSDRYDRRVDYRKDDRDKHKHRSRDRDKNEDSRSKDRDTKSRDRDYKGRDKDGKYKKDDKFKKDVKVDVAKDKEESCKEKDNTVEPQKSTERPLDKEKDAAETDVNLNDYLVCDSWSLDNEDKKSPKVTEKPKKDLEDALKKEKDPVVLDPLQQLRQSLGKATSASPKPKVEKLRPVVDCFEFEIDPNEEVIDIFDEDTNGEKYNKTTTKKSALYHSPGMSKYDKDSMNDDTFLESVINEIKQENMSDDETHEKGLVEYDESPVRDSNDPSVGSVTPDLDDSMRGQSQRSDYSDGYKSTDSRKSTESGYKSTESEYKSEGSQAKPNDYKSVEQECKNDKFKSTFKPTETKSDASKSSEGRSTSEGGKSDKSKRREPSKEERDFFSVERELDEALEAKMSKDTVESLETWSFVLKICQPLLFRHDKNKCYKETRVTPKVWFAQNPKLCNCVTDRSIVYEELERCKMDLVDGLYGCAQIPDSPQVIARSWYPQSEQCFIEVPAPMQLTSEWDVDEESSKPGSRSDGRMSMTPGRSEDQSLDREYQRFMEAVSWPETSQSSGVEGRSLTPVRLERKSKMEDNDDRKRDSKRMKMSSEGWSQDSEEDDGKNKPAKAEKVKRKEKRKRKRSSSTASTASSDETDKKRKKALKKKEGKKSKLKAKRRRLEKKVLKKLKDKKKKKKIEKIEADSDLEDEEKESKKKDKKAKKKKQQKLKKKAEKKKKRVKSISTSSSDSSSSESSSDSEAVSEKRVKKKKKDTVVKKKKKKDKKKKRKQSSSESASGEDLFDVNILNNIKTERLTDDEKRQDTSPLRKHREIIDVKELHQDFSSNIQIKQEVEEESKRVQTPQAETPKPENEPEKEAEAQKDIAAEIDKKEDEKSVEIEVAKQEVTKTEEEVPKVVEKVVENVEVSKTVESEVELMNRFDLEDNNDQYSAVVEKSEKVEFKEPEIPTPPPRVDDTSQCSSQESIQSITSVKGAAYEKDDSHLRPSCDNSNYSFNDVINSQQGYKNMEDKFEEYENYEMYEQMAMAYQSDVASQQISPPSSSCEQRIETVVLPRARGEIKCDWRAGDRQGPTAQHHRPSRWGLKPGEVNIVLTGGEGGEGGDAPPANSTPGPEPVYQIQSLANRDRSDTSMGYDEAYMDMYGASDRLQYGDCFAPPPAPARAADPAPRPPRTRPDSLDDRIDRALRTTVLGEVAKNETADKDTPEKGILVTKSLSESRSSKRVSYADGYKPGQDSDVEDPPVKKRKKKRRVGCAWPCPVSHPDHVPLWDALPPPPPPPGSPPPPPAPAPPPLHLLTAHAHMRQYRQQGGLPASPHVAHTKFNPAATIPNFMPPEPPPGLISFP